MNRPAFSEPPLNPDLTSERFAHHALPHLDAAYSLARWITGNDQDANDVVQESFMRALRGFESFRGIDLRPWLLTIVRNASYSFIQQNRRHDSGGADLDTLPTSAASPPVQVVDAESADLLKKRIAELPAPFREALILRDLEGLSYKEISDITGVSIGTVMSRLNRARKRLQESFNPQEVPRELH